MVELTIDGKTVEVEEGTTVFQAAKSLGIKIPHLCYHKHLLPTGACRLCLVEVEGARSLVASCACPVSPGIKVMTNTDRVINARKMVIDLLLSDHPQDCLICEKNGDCKLQNYAYQLGVRSTSFKGERHVYPIDSSNPFIERDYNKCILCGRCVATCATIQRNNVVDFAGRGFETRIATYFDRPMQESNCVFCGQCVGVCPVGALTEKEAKFKGRSWEFSKVTTTCPYCGTGCRFDLNVKDNRIIKVTPSWDAPANQGRLCVKGKFGLDFVNREDRLKTPLVRRNGELQKAGWNEALDLVAKKLSGIKEKHGPDSIGGLCSAKCTNEDNYIFQKFMRAAVGTNNVDHCARLCHASTVAGLATAFGSGAMTNSIDEIAGADCILVTGSNTTENHPVIALKIKEAVNCGAKLLLFDPRSIELADWAHLHLRQRPGTDVAWLNGLMNVIIAEDLHDKDFIRERCENFEAMAETVAKYTPEYVESITGIPADKLREAARIYATAKAASIIYSMGITQHSHGTDNVLCCANLAMLTGNVGKPYSGVNPLRGQNNVQGACDMGGLPNVYPGYQKVADEAVRAKFEKAWGVKLPANPGLTLTEMINAAGDGRLKALYIMGENPMLADPDINHVKEALQSLDFLVCQDIFLTETAALANVVLPAISFAEKDGTFTNTERRVQMVRKAIPPVGESREDWQIITEVSKRMGYKMVFRVPDEMPVRSAVKTAKGYRMAYRIPDLIMAEIAKLTPSYGGISHSRLEKEGGLPWPCPNPTHPGTPYLHGDKFTRGLGLFSAIEFKEPAELPDEEYPYTLTTGRMLYHFHTGSMSRRSKGLDEIVPEGYVEINPADAADLSIEDDQFVKVSSRRGQIDVKAKVTDIPPQGVVFMPFHFAEAAANVLTNPVLDPVAKIPELKVCAVRIEK
ncbi:MAG: formate dehydrogenase subunit alpha [bacterium]|nr:formate dehydrogenase subunit alpha [bacterium]